MRSPDNDSTLMPRRAGVKGQTLSSKPIPTLVVLYHPDLDRIGDRYFIGELESGLELQLSRTSPHFYALGNEKTRPLGDPFLSRKPLRFSRTRDGVVKLISDRMSLQVDGVDVGNVVNLNQDRVKRGVVILLANRVILWFQVRARSQSLPRARYGLIGESPLLLEALARLENTADLDIPVLIRGETGSGKELFARAVHEASTRRRGPFLAVNLAAVAPNLAASELFGSVEGAFTGARARSGYFKKASGGTLFLDEIGEAPMDIQPMLLRALENREIIPVGADTPLKPDTRLVIATDASLEDAVADGRFRAPLFHRLSGFVVRLPPLRERREDIGLLVRHFLHVETKRTGGERKLLLHNQDDDPWMPPELMVRLVMHDWPGNVRELANAIRQLVIAGRNSDQLPLDEWQGVECPHKDEAWTSNLASGTRKPTEVSSEELTETLKACNYELSATASRLNLSRTTLYALIRRTEGVRMAADYSPDEIREAHRACNGDLDAMVTSLQISGTALRRRLSGLGLETKGSA